MTNSYPAPHFILSGVSVFMAEAMKTKICFVAISRQYLPTLFCWESGSL